MPTDPAQFIDLAARDYRASDHHMGRFALCAYKVTNVRFLVEEDGAQVQKPGAKVLAAACGVSPDTVEDHAAAYALFVKLIRRGYGKPARDYWKWLYKSHWIAVADAYRKHQDLEVALVDLDNLFRNKITPRDARKALEREKSLGERLHTLGVMVDRQLEEMWEAADKERDLLPYIRKVRKMHSDYFAPALDEALQALDRKKDRQKKLDELGFRDGKGIYG